MGYRQVVKTPDFDSGTAGSTPATPVFSALS